MSFSFESQEVPITKAKNANWAALFNMYKYKCTMYYTCIYECIPIIEFGYLQN